MKTSQKNKLDKIWSKKIRERGKCEVCGRTDYPNAHHIIGRRNITIRWDVKNGVCLCPKHHTFGTESAHQDPIWFEEWLEVNRKTDLSYLREMRNKVLKRTYEEILAELEG